MTGRILTLLLFSLCASAQEARVLKIIVTDPSALPVAKARVTVRAVAGGVAVELSTDVKGVAQFAPPLEGRLLIVARAEGFADESSFTEWHGQAESVALQLSVTGLREQVTVTSGSRVEELREDSPVKVDVVTRQSMMTTGYERLTDVLAEIPGIVTRSGSTASVGAEQIRGISARQVAVLQDGLPMIGARGIKSGNLNLNRQSTGRLERVEVVKGAASALYGSDAIGGVVNMISRVGMRWQIGKE